MFERAPASQYIYATLADIEHLLEHFAAFRIGVAPSPRSPSLALHRLGVLGISLVLVELGCPPLQRLQMGLVVAETGQAVLLTRFRSASVLDALEALALV